jgi:hypothetical protein
VQKDTCFGVLTGELWGQKDFALGPKLLLYIGENSNELFYVQDCAWVNLLKSKPVEPNVHFQVAWSNNLPIVVCNALRYSSSFFITPF